MLLKSFSKTGRKCRVTFKLPAEIEADEVHLVGDFNEWSKTSHPMKQLKDGSYSLSMWLESDEKYRYRYLLNGETWENDWDPDAYAPNEHGTDDSIVDTTLPEEEKA